MRRCCGHSPCIFVALLSVWLAWPAAAKTPKVTVILDGSGSMWGKVEGKHKIAHAKRVLGELFDHTPKSTKLGLVVYGHRRKNDCKDVEFVARPGELERAALKQRVQGIKPKGHTPLALSIERTVDAIRGKPGPHTVILVTDGLETCGGDPCRLVRKLRRSGVKLTMHVIGFGVTVKEGAQLECIAKAGGGQYRTAADGTELAVAMRRAVEKRRVRRNLEVSAYRNGKRFRALVRIFKAGEKKLHDYGQCTERLPVGFGLAPGRYDIEVEDHWGSKVKQRLEKVKVVARKVTKKRVDFDLATLKVEARQGDKPMKAIVILFKSGTKTRVADSQTNHQGSCSFSLVPGRYDAQVEDHWRSKAVVWIRGITLKRGATLTKRAIFTLGTLALKVLHKGKPWKVVVTLYKAGTKTTVRSMQTGYKGDCSFRLAPGRYDAKVKDPWRLRKEVWLRGLEVKQNKTLSRTAHLEK